MLAEQLGANCQRRHPIRGMDSAESTDVGCLWINDSLHRLHASVVAASRMDPAQSRTAKLLRQGIVKIAKKLAEEAVEVGLEAVQGEREAVVLESADLLYNLAVLWAAMGVSVAEVEAELARRERLFGIAEKLPKREAGLQKARLKLPGDVLVSAGKR